MLESFLLDYLISLKKKKKHFKRERCYRKVKVSINFPWRLTTAEVVTFSSYAKTNLNRIESASYK